jgi:serine/threonine-protein kinase
MLPIASDTLLQQRYRILNSLGEGGFGRTYLATDSGRFDEYCAIKELTPVSQSAANLEKAKEFFKREAALLYQLQHPQIPRFWATFEERDRLFLVQDYIAGQTYRTLLDERQSLGKQFSEAQMWRFLLQVLPVLGYIHSKGVIHRDLSPDNIILRESDHLPVLIDFGVVKEFADRLQGVPKERRGIVGVGKPGYAPPEQLAAGQAYPSSDLYALAVTAVVLLTGKEPSALFEGERMNWTWRRWIHVSDGLVNVLHRMLSPKPSERYQSAVDVFQALQSLSIPNAQPPELPEPGAEHPPQMRTRAVGYQHTPSITNRLYSAITNINAKSVWEKPQVFIPVGVLISLLAGLGGWFGVKLLTQPGGLNTSNIPGISPQPSSSGAAKPAEFENPTILSQSNSTIDPNAPIQPLAGQAIVREGSVDSNTPVRYKLAANPGQNLDISTGSPQVLMTVISPLGLPVDSPPADRVSGWRGQIANGGEYTIELRPIQGLQGNAFPYKLTVTQLVPTAETAPTIGIPGSDSNPIPTIPSNNGLPSGTVPSNTDGTQMPTFTPSPVPIEVPSTQPLPQNAQPEKPTRRRRRINYNTDGKTQPRRSRRVRERDRSTTNTEETPTKSNQDSGNPTTETVPEEQPSPSSEVERRESIPVPLPESSVIPTTKPESTDSGTPNNESKSVRPAGRNNSDSLNRTPAEPTIAPNNSPAPESEN